MKLLLAGRRVEADEPAAGEVQPDALPVNRRDYGRRIARQFGADAELLLTGELVERDDGRAAALAVHEFVDARRRPLRAAADPDDEQVAFDDGAATHAEEILKDEILLVRVDLPNLLAKGG